jgi:hypothetical protein
MSIRAINRNANGTVRRRRPKAVLLMDEYHPFEENGESEGGPHF